MFSVRKDLQQIWGRATCGEMNNFSFNNLKIMCKYVGENLISDYFPTLIFQIQF